MQVLLDDLAKADSMYEKMYDSSVNSANSAMNENAIYMQSLEARINLVRVEIEKLSLAIGEAFLTEGMVQALKIFSEFLQMITGLVSHIGALPALFGGVTIALTLFSNRFKDLLTTIGTYIVTAYKAKVATDQLATSKMKLSRTATIARFSTEADIASLKKDTKETELNNKAKKSSAKSTSALAVGFGALGVAGIGLGIALEAVLGKMQEARQAQEELIKENEQLQKSYSDNSSKIDDLVQKYVELESRIGDLPNPNSEVYQEYLRVQNEIANLMPNLVRGEDEYGNKIIGTSSAVEAKIALLKEQIAQQQKLNAVQSQSERQKELDDAKSNATNSRNKIDSTIDDASKTFLSYTEQFRKNGFKDLGFEDGLKSAEDMYKALTNIYQALENPPKEGFSEQGIDRLNVLKVVLENSINDVRRYQNILDSSMLTIKSSIVDNINQTIGSYSKFNKETKELAENVSLSALTFIESKDALEKFNSVVDRIKVSEDLTNGFEELNNTITKMSKTSSSSVEELANTFGVKLLEIKQQILRASNLQEYSESYNALSRSLDNLIGTQYNYMLKVLETSKAEKISMEDAKLRISTLEEESEALSGLTQESQAYLAQLKEKESAIEEIAGVSQNLADEVNNLIFTYETLNAIENKTTEQTKALEKAKSNLKLIYPDLVKEGKIQINMIKEEAKANDLLLEAYKLSSEGKLNEEEKMTLYASQETLNRIKILREEILALEEAINARKALAESLPKEGFVDVSEFQIGHSFWLPTDELNLKSKKAELDSYMSSIQGITKNIQGLIDSSNKRSEAEKKTSKETKNNIYITDKYKQAIEELNTQIAKYQALQDKFPSHSAEYRKYLNEELKLLNKKKTLIEEQTKALEKQIKTGKVAQTGSISEPKYDTTTVSRVSGNTNADKIWNFFKSKGFSDGIVAGIMGNLKMESNLNPSAVNKSSGAYGIAQWLGGRKNGLSSYAKSLGTSMDDLTTQLNYLWKELNSSEKKTLNWIKNNPNASASEMAKMFDKLFERSEGTHIPQRQKYANEFLSAYRGSGSSTSVTSVKTAVSTTQEAIDSAKSQLESLKNELIDISSDIAKVEQEIINSHLESFTVYRDKIEKAIEYDNTRLTTLDSKSKRYNDTILAQVENKKKLVKSYQDEAKYIKQLIDSGSLSAVVLEEMTNRMQELEDAVLKAKIAIQETNFALINNIINNFNDEIDDIEYLIARSQGLAELFEEGSIDQKNEISKQIELMNEELKLIDEKKKAIEQQMRVLDLSTQDVKELEEQLEDLNIQYIQLKGSIKSATKELEDFDKTTKEALEDIADKVIDAYKSAIETQKKIKIDALEEAKEETLDAIDEEIDAENERHDNVMKNLDDELNRYRDIINAKLKQIRRDDSTRTYENELQELQDERAKLQQQLQNLAFNNSFEGLAKRKELNEKIADIDKEIQELQYKRGLELREDNLEDMLELKEDEIEERKELEDEYHNKYTKQLEARKKATEKALDEEIRYYEAYYDELLHDEKTFQELRQAVLDQNFALIESKFNGLIDDLKSAMPDFEFTVNGTWKSVANTLRNTVIKELEDALALIKKFQQEQSKLGTSVKNPLDNFDGSGENGQLTEADMKVILAKFLTDKVAPNESGTRANSIREKAHALAEQGRNEGSKVSSSTGLNDILDNLTSEELQRLGNYFQNNVSDANLSTQKYVDYIKNYGKSFNENQTTLSEADMQVLLAKYMKDVLRLKTDNTSLRNAIINTADKIAQKGRNNGSILSSTKGFNEIVSTLSSSQLKSLSNYFSNNSGIISNAELRDELLKYAKQLGTASLDVGGMTPNWSGAGIDGKGGRFAVLHPNEIINNPIDSQNLVKSVSIIDNIMRNIISSIKLPSAPSLSPSTTEIIRDVSIVFQIDKMNGDRNDLDRFSKMINDKLLREKGKR